MKTRTGKRTARLGVQIVENPKNITLFFDGHDLPPIIFNAKTGQSGKKAHRKLQRIIDDVEAKGEIRTAKGRDGSGHGGRQDGLQGGREGRFEDREQAQRQGRERVARAAPASAPRKLPSAEPSLGCCEPPRPA